jgi:hypothetical protein
VDTLKALETTVSESFAASHHQINRTLVKSNMSIPRLNMSTARFNLTIPKLNMSTARLSLALVESSLPRVACGYPAAAIRVTVTGAGRRSPTCWRHMA